MVSSLTSFRARKILTAVLLLLAGFFYIATGAYRAVDPYDEGIALYGAERVLGGQVPYRDFWTLYGPAQFYLLAGVIWLFGKSILAARLWDVLLRAALALLVYLCAGKLASRTYAFAAWLVALLWLERAGSFGYPAFPAALCVLAAIYSAMNARDAEGLRQELLFGAAGACTGAALLFRHDFGVYAVPPILILITAPRVRTLGAFALGFAAVAAVPALLLGTLVPPATLVDIFIRLPRAHAARLHLSQGGFREAFELLMAMDLSQLILRFFPHGVLLLLIGFLLLRRRALPGHLARPLLSLAALTACLLFHAHVRADMIHLLPAYLPALVILSALAAHAGLQNGAPRGARLLFLLLLLPLFAAPLKSKLISAVSTTRSAAGGHGIPRAEGVRLDLQQTEVLRFLSTRVEPDELFFSAVAADSSIQRNDVSLYFLSGRKSPTPYHEVHPALFDRAVIQQQVIDDLLQAGVDWVVLRSETEASEEEVTRRLGESPSELERVLGCAFETAAVFGRYHMMQRIRELRECKGS